MIDGFGSTEQTTDAAGRAQQKVSYSYGASFLMLWDRDRHPIVKFYFGGAPVFDTPDEVETWIVHLPFDEPWSANHVRPAVQLERASSFEDTKIDGRFRQKGSRPLPSGDGEIEPLEIVLDTDTDGFGVYRIPLTIHLNAAQIASCTHAAAR